MPLPDGYLEGNVTQRIPRPFSTRGISQESKVVYVSWAAPAAASLTSFVTTSAGPNTATSAFQRTGYSFPIGVAFDGARADGAMDCPRNVVVTVTHASAVVAVSGVITGVDEYNRVLTEAWTVTATGTTKTFTGAKAFARVDSVTVVAVADASANTVKVGMGSVLGLPSRSALAGVAVAVAETIDGVIAVTGTLTAASTVSTADAQGTFLAATIPNATHNYEVWYLVNDPLI